MEIPEYVMIFKEVYGLNTQQRKQKWREKQ